MKPYLLIILICFTSLTSCDKEDVNYATIEGNYTGIFQRGVNTSDVALHLVNNEFSGGSTEGYNKFPAICKGTYTIKNKEIIFNNTCIWTAEFDWTLILSGTWNYTFKNNTLTLNNSFGDVYILNKQD